MMALLGALASKGGGLFGGGSSATAPAAGPTAPAPASTITGGAVSPSTSAEDYKKQQSAYWQQLLQGTGQSPGGALPEGIQSNIEREAALIK